MTYTEILAAMDDGEIRHLIKELREFYPDHDLLKFAEQELEFRELFN